MFYALERLRQFPGLFSHLRAHYDAYQRGRHLASTRSFEVRSENRVDARKAAQLKDTEPDPATQLYEYLGLPETAKMVELRETNVCGGTDEYIGRNVVNWQLIKADFVDDDVMVLGIVLLGPA